MSSLIFNTSSQTINNSSNAYGRATSNSQIPVIVIATCGVILNIFTVVIIGLYKPMHKRPTNMLIVNQSIIDVFAASFLIVFNTVTVTNGNLKPEELYDEFKCRVLISQVPMWSLIVSSIYGIVAITFERFLAVVYPVWHKANLTRKHITKLSVIVWMTGPVFYMPYNTIVFGISNQGTCGLYVTFTENVSRLIAPITLFLYCYIIPLSLLIFFYAKMNWALRSKKTLVGNILIVTPRIIQATSNEETLRSENEKQSVIGLMKKENKSNPTNPSDTPETNKIGPIPTVGVRLQITNQFNNSLREWSGISPASASVPVTTAPKQSLSTTRARRNILVTMVMVGVGFIVCWTCGDVNFFLVNVGVIPPNFTGNFYMFTIILRFMSCSINPIIYCIQYEQFQQGVKWVFRPKKIIPLHGLSKRSTISTVTTYSI